MLKSNCKTTFKWFELNNQNDEKEYRKVWFHSKLRRPHDHPAFLELMCPSNFSPAAVVFQSSEGDKILYSFYWCEVDKKLNLVQRPQTRIHILSSYGYGGPTFFDKPINREKTALEFEDVFETELLKRNCVSEFTREDLDMEYLVPRTVGLHVEQQNNVVVRLDRPAEMIWKEYKQKVRKNVNKAKSNDLNYVVDRNGEYLDDFLSVYIHTMERTKASPSFFISKNKFQTYIEKTFSDGCFAFANVYHKDKIVSTELVLLSRSTIYSFLGGTVSNAMDLRPNDFLKHETIMWGAVNGYKKYVLGGGVTPGDGIFKYKEAFDPNGIIPFYVRKIIYNKLQYADLVLARREKELSNGINWEPVSSFFPEYFA